MSQSHSICVRECWAYCMWAVFSIIFWQIPLHVSRQWIYPCRACGKLLWIFFFHADIKNASLELLETNVVLRLITIAQGVYFHVPWKVHWNFWWIESDCFWRNCNLSGNNPFSVSKFKMVAMNWNLHKNPRFDS